MVNVQSKNSQSPFTKKQEFDSKKMKNRNIPILGQVFVSPTGLRHLREMKTSTNDEN